MTRIFLFLLLAATFCSSCNPYKRFQQANPTPINAKRIMFVVMPMQEVVLPLSSFFTVCDSIFKKNNITRTVVILNPEDFDGTTPKKDPIAKYLLAFQPDCLIFFKPDRLERNARFNFVRYTTLMIPIEPADYLLLDHAEDYKKKNPIYINAVELTAISTLERNRNNGIDAANNFLKELKRHLSNHQYPLA